MNKKSVLGIASIMVILFSALAGLQSIQLVWANGIPAPPISEIYIKSDGSIEPSTVPIQQEGNVYAFTGNLINYTIEVQHDDLVIDGGGFTLQGHGTHWHTAIKLSNRSNATIKNVHINQYGWGIEAINSSNIIITGNEIYSFYGVHLSYSNSSQIVRNSMSPAYGIHGAGSFNLIIRNNFTSPLTGSGTGVGVDFWGGVNNTISENHFEDQYSISLRSNYNTVSYNIIANGGTGISIIKSSYNTVFGNNITKKSDHGIWISESSNNTFYQNYLANNEVGIYVANPAFPVAGFPYSTDNTFYKNNLIGNSENVHVEREVVGGPRPNFWDNGKEGNYWSDYTGVDNDGNGIGDTACVIDANNTDHYPLMEYTEIPEFSTAAPTLLALAVLTVAFSAYKRKIHRKIRNKKRAICKHELKNGETPKNE